MRKTLGSMAAASAMGAVVLLAGNCPAAAGTPADVDGARIVAADRDPGNWLTYGRTYGEQRFSPLTHVTADNVKRLGLDWFADLDSNRGQEATPLVIDGVLYVSTAWSLVKAYDAKAAGLCAPTIPKCHVSSASMGAATS